MFCAGSLFLTAVRAQTPDSSINTFSARYAQEKIHIHFDKDTYLPGETIWMKAYLLCGSKPSGFSKSVYFDWTDADGRLLSHSIAPVNEGNSVSSFLVPASVPGGVVHLKAYTQWMLNFDNDFLYNKNIPILTMADQLDAPEKTVTTLRFFPEGGDLVSGVSSTVAFEALDQHGRPVKVSGIIKNGKKSLDSFHTVHMGMGSLQLQPSGGDQYLAIWREDGSTESHSTVLPQAKPNGVMLHTFSPSGKQIGYSIERSADAASMNHITLIGMMDQKVIYHNSVVMSNRKSEGLIDIGSFPLGLLQLTVLDADQNPQAERLVFINGPRPAMHTTLKKDLVNMNRRSRNELTVEIPDSLVTNLSVSVTDAGLGYDSSHNIYSDLLLTSDLKEYVHDAASYLDAEGSEGAARMNLLLMTHGWRRFNWAAATAGKNPDLRFPMEDRFLTLSGTVKDVPAAEGDSIALLVITKDKRKGVIRLPVNADGSFNQSGLMFFDSVQVMYKYNHPEKLANAKSINLYSGLLPALTPAQASEPAYPWLRVPDVVLEKEFAGNLVETKDYSVAVSSTSILAPRGAMTKGATESASHYLATNFVEMRFPATMKKTPAADVHFASVKGKPGAAPAKQPNVAVTMDGAAMGMDDLANVSMKEVLFIKLLGKASPKALPVLAITSRQALDQNLITGSKTGFTYLTGYTPAREFYAPKYATDKILDYHTTDFRTTIYWNPKVRLDKGHKTAKLTFYNNDISNKLRIVVEGMDEEGHLTHIEEILK